MLLAVCGPFDWNIEGSSPHAIFRSPGNAFSVLQCPSASFENQKSAERLSPELAAAAHGRKAIHPGRGG